MPPESELLTGGNDVGRVYPDPAHVNADSLPEQHTAVGLRVVANLVLSRLGGGHQSGGWAGSRLDDAIGVEIVAVLRHLGSCDEQQVALCSRTLPGDLELVAGGQAGRRDETDLGFRYRECLSEQHTAVGLGVVTNLVLSRLGRSHQSGGRTVFCLMHLGA